MAEVKSNDSIGRTLLVVLVLCLVCSVVVAGSAVGLKSRQQEQKALDKQRNILDVAGLATPKMTGDEVKSTFESRITPRLLDLKTGEMLDKTPAKFDQAAALHSPSESIEIAANEDRAGIKRRSNIVEIYLVRDEQNKVQEVVLPVYGKGLWSMMYAFVSLQTDGRTVKGITYYDQGETRGLAVKLKTRTGVHNGSARNCWMITANRRFVWLKVGHGRAINTVLMVFLARRLRPTVYNILLISGWANLVSVRS